MQPTSVPQVFLFGQKRTQACFRGFFSMQMRGVGLKNGVPYLQMGLSTLVSRVCRRPEEQRTSFNQSIPCRFYTLASRHSTSGFLHGKRKLAHPSALAASHTTKWNPQTKLAHQNVAQRCGQEYAIYQCPAGFLVWPQSAPRLLQGFFSMQMRGVGLKKGVPYLQMGLSTLVSRVSRRPKEKRTRFN